MGKWNKAPPEVSEEFLQNQERRKQMIIEAARRRKEKEKKLQEQVQIQKKNEQQALLKHKQQKKDAYVKYLRNNMHDKYEEMKRNEKLNQPEVRTKSKWKKDTLDSNSQIRPQNNLEGLDLSVNIPTRNNRVTNTNNNRVINNKTGGQVIRNPPPYQSIKHQQPPNQPSSRWPNSQQQNLPSKKQSSQKRRLLQDEFQNMWQQQHQEPQKQFDYELSVQQTIFDDMMGSKLLDSLDLDLDTVSRGKKLDKKMREEKKKQTDQQKKQNKQDKEIDQIKNMIGYESVLMSIDQRSEMIKKYNQFMTNQVHQEQTTSNKTEQQNNKAFSKDKFSHDKNSKSKGNKQQPPQKPAKSINQGELFNQLKNKKEGKILNWAQGEAQEADDLFSNCSTNKKSKTRGFQLLKEINKEIHQKVKRPPTQSSNTSLNQQQVNMKKKEKPLETIPQKKINSSLERLRQRSYQNKKHSQHQVQSGSIPQNNPQNRSQQIRRSSSKQKVTQVNQARPTRINSAQNRNQPPQPPRNLSKQRVNKTATNSFNRQNRQSNISVRVNSNLTQPIQQQRKDNNRRSLSKEKEGTRSEKEIPAYGQGYERNPPLKVQRTVSSARQGPNPSNTNVALPSNTVVKKLPHLPPTYQRPSNAYDQITIATQDQVFQVQSFIKNQLLSLNREQRQLQEELKSIHVQNKDKLKEVEKKYDIKTDYKYSHELRQKEQGIQQEEEDNRTQNSYQQAHKRQTEDQLEESIQRLDDMLLRKEIINKEKGSRITEQDNQSESTHRSLINPMSDPISLHKQVLQLAGNLSRFEGEPEDPTTGYGAKLRMKQKSMEKENKTEQRRPESSIKQRQTQIELSQSQDVNFSQLNSVQAGKSKLSKTSKVSKPPQLQYSQHGSSANIPAGYNESGLLDDEDELEDSIEKGKIQVNERLRRMLLE